IVWRKYSGRKNNAKHKFSTQSDSIFLYAKSNTSFFQPIFMPISDKEIEKEYKYKDVNGRKYRLSRGRHYQMTGEQRKIYLDEQPGAAISSLWVEDRLQLNTSSKERTGYPTQKPLKLLERIISASSNEGDVVLDPFCGCATACVAAEQLNRQWIGIDISPSAEDITKLRLQEEVDKQSDLWNPLEDITVSNTPPPNC
ncbi:site-specific DNA-methyltransferase, partial [Candidatus Poribacteria bacterium]|nr:site-specific DNA-methyltransferase [Candidatus Poribacteria bacterium]